MNAKELADLLETTESTNNKAATMLRNQQAEIERLIGAEPITYGMFTVCKNCGQQNPYFEKAQEQEGVSLSFIDHPIGEPVDEDKGLNPDSLETIEVELPDIPAKTLTDEQIFKLAEMLEIKMNHALYAFARTLITNAQENLDCYEKLSDASKMVSKPISEKSRAILRKAQEK